VGLTRPLVNAPFLNVKDGEARRLMARWIMENRVDRAEGLKDFDVEGYKYDPKASSENELVFSRKQPPVKK